MVSDESVYRQLDHEQERGKQEQKEHRDGAEVEQQKERAVDSVAADQHRHCPRQRNQCCDKEHDLFHNHSK